MIDLVVGTESFRYCPGGTPLTDLDADYFDERDESLTRDHPRLRRILVRFMPDSPLRMKVLHWSDGSDLTALDDLLREGGPGAGHFANAIAGELLDHACDACGTKYRAAVYSSSITLGMGVEGDKISGHGFQSTCPECRAPVRRSVLEFLARG